MAPLKSIYWKFFDKSGDMATCRICNKILKTSGNTTNLKSHMKKNHPKIESNTIISRNKENEQQENQTKNSDNSEISESSESKRKKARITTLAIKKQNDELLPSISTSSSPNLITTNVCKEVKVQKTVKESFQNICAYKEGGEENRELLNAILFMIVKDCQPLSIIENIGFKKVITTAAPYYEIPSRFTIKRKIESKFDVLSALFKEKLKSMMSCTLTTDIWTDTMQTRSFLGVTVHFGVGSELYSATLGVYDVQERHTGEYIADKLLETCSEWNIQKDQVTAVVTDSAANMIKAVTIAFGANKHIPCFAHMINLVSTKALKKNESINELIIKVKTIVTWFKQSVVASDELKKATTNETKLIQEVPTRWNSTLYMVERFLKLRRIVNDIVNRHVEAPPMITAKEIEILTEICDLLKPLKVATKQICAEKYVTSSIIIPMVRCLQSEINKLCPKHVEGIQLKEDLLYEIKTRFDHIEHVQILALSTLLDPRFKKLHFKDILACSKAQSVLKNLVTESMTHSNDVSFTKSASDPDHSSSSGFSLWSDHHKLVQNTWNETKANDLDSENMPSEITLYMRAPVGRLGDNPFEMWKEMSSTYVYLSKIAFKYLTIVGTSVPSERLFSKAGLIFTHQRNKLKGKILSRLLFLHSLDEQKWSL
ncbi:zinc finger BED domain-containing protein 4-like [Pseudomyrmex gracilis]|uniref:zinc finger BED domain-containing protein 4-like n=1 Tax=Pseudomyrmex gracilis TaxID=219809 RepID=UPI0009952C65|nr:zinc finger BED domain-containing protein 4-like [Pseudomyrmex gracilis]